MLYTAEKKTKSGVQFCVLLIYLFLCNSMYVCVKTRMCNICVPMTCYIAYAPRSMLSDEEKTDKNKKELKTIFYRWAFVLVAIECWSIRRLSARRREFQFRVGDRRVTLRWAHCIGDVRCRSSPYFVF